MNKISNALFLKEAIDACFYFWQKGWGENHAGNVSYLLSDYEIEEYQNDLKVKRSIPITFNTLGLTGKIFLVTRSGSIFRKAHKQPEIDFGVIKVNENSLDILWGFEENNKPTSELSAHLQCHAVRLSNNKNNKIVMHCHPTYTIAMTFCHSLNEDEFNQTLWSLNSECVLVFPEGVAILPWMVCGDSTIGEETAKKMQYRKAVIWPYHGLFVAGNSFDDVIGLVETIEKNAQVFMLNQGKLIQKISKDQIKLLAQSFGVDVSI